MKQVCILVLALFTAQLSIAQGKYGATAEDSVTCIENLIYKDYLKSDPTLALSLWKKAYAICPGSQKSLYINGAKMYKTLIKNEQDEVKKSLLVDTLLAIYDQRIQYFKQEGFVLGLKGIDMSKYRERADAYKVLTKSVALQGDKTSAGVLMSAMFASVSLEKKGKLEKAEVVSNFTKFSQICAANANGKKADKYAKAQKNLDTYAAAYLDCDVIVPMAEKGFEVNKDNLDWLKNMAALMKRKKCTKNDAFVMIAEKVVEVEPSAEGYANLGVVLFDQGKYSKANEMFTKAIANTSSEEEKADYYMNMALSYYKMKQYSNTKSYALKAAKGKSGWGAPYVLIGDAYASTAGSCSGDPLDKFGAYWAAVDKYQKAKSVDSSVASSVNKKIGSMKARYPSTQDVFFYGKKTGDAYKVTCWIGESTIVRTK